MKKCMLIALITVFTLVTVGTLCSADSRRGVANTSKKGSLLVFPLIKVGASTEDANDTIITISNDYPGSVKVMCRYATPENCYCDPFDFRLTANQSIAFSAKTGRGLDDERTLSRFNIGVDPFPTLGGQYAGELRCWAINGSNYPISWNHLAGTAMISEGEDQTWQYSAWRFAVGYQVGRNQNVLNASGGLSKSLRLTGMPTTYDACPESLIFNFIRQVEDPASGPYSSAGDTNAENRITLVPCKQDCVVGGKIPVRAYFEISDEYENSDYTSACYDCTDNATAFYSKSLSDSAKFVDPAAFTGLVTPSGMAIVTNTPTGECGEMYGVPLLGVISNKLYNPTGPVSGETMTVLGRGQPELTDANGNRTGIEIQMNY